MEVVFIKNSLFIFQPFLKFFIYISSPRISYFYTKYIPSIHLKEHENQLSELRAKSSTKAKPQMPI